MTALLHDRELLLERGAQLLAKYSDLGDILLVDFLKSTICFLQQQNCTIGVKAFTLLPLEVIHDIVHHQPSLCIKHLATIDGPFGDFARKTRKRMLIDCDGVQQMTTGSKRKRPDLQCPSELRGTLIEHICIGGSANWKKLSSDANYSTKQFPAHSIKSLQVGLTGLYTNLTIDCRHFVQDYALTTALESIFSAAAARSVPGNSLEIHCAPEVTALKAFVNRFVSQRHSERLQIEIHQSNVGEIGRLLDSFMSDHIEVLKLDQDLYKISEHQLSAIVDFLVNDSSYDSYSLDFGCDHDTEIPRRVLRKYETEGKLEHSFENMQFCLYERSFCRFTHKRGDDKFCLSLSLCHQSMGYSRSSISIAYALQKSKTTRK